ncbi:hypothetical protein ACROYT_G008296 [Oculina patagonica]
MEMAPFVASSDLSRLGAKLSTSTTYVYSKPVSSFYPSVITFGQRESPSFISGGSMREGIQPQEGFEHQEGESIRCPRTHFTAFQRNELEKTFSQSQYISPRKRQSLAQELGIPDKVILTWFKNRRAKWRKEQRKAGPRSESSSVSTGLYFYYCGHVPYPNSQLMMRDARMLYRTSIAHASDEKPNTSAHSRPQSFCSCT